jgi:phosphoadenosine phosphosulfate reductase
LVEQAQNRAVEFEQRYRAFDADELMHTLIQDEFPSRIAVLSSFGTESALLLALAADIDKHIPVLFIDTGKMFPETLEYRDTLVDLLGLTDVRTIAPSPVSLAARDPEGQLWQFDADACCRLRKVEPLAISLGGIDAVMSGRKRYHGALRQMMPRFQFVDGRIKIDPLAHWTPERVEAEFRRRDLPQHPLQAEGYASIGCEPCTIPVAAGGPIRAGRWAGAAKTECGIHLPSGALAHAGA